MFMTVIPSVCLNDGVHDWFAHTTEVENLQKRQSWVRSVWQEFRQRKIANTIWTTTPCPKQIDGEVLRRTSGVSPHTGILCQGSSSHPTILPTVIPLARNMSWVSPLDSDQLCLGVDLNISKTKNMDDFAKAHSQSTLIFPVRKCSKLDCAEAIGPDCVSEKTFKKTHQQNVEKKQKKYILFPVNPCALS